MIFGLLAATGWGASAVAAAVAVRRATAFAIVLLSQAIGVVALAGLALAVSQASSPVTAKVALGLGAAGLIGLLGYLTFYRAITLGPPGLMSAISSTYGGVAAGLAVGALGERMTGLGVAGILLAVVGVVLAAAKADGPGTTAGPAFPRSAVWLAGGSAIAYGVSGFLLADFSRRGGWLLSGIIAHGTAVAAMLAVLAVPRGRELLRRRATATHAGRPGGERSGSRAVLGWAAAAGLADAAGLIAYSRGAQIGQAAITAAISSVYPVIPLAVGVAVLGERLSRRQLAGIAIIITGLALLGLA